MVMSVWETLDSMNKKRSKEDKIRILKENESWALKDIIRGSIDESVEWNLPQGDAPYTPAPEESHPANLQRENQKFIYFVKGGQGDHMPAYKRERIFLGILEGVHPKDAELVSNMVRKVIPKGLSRPIVEQAFPGLLKDDSRSVNTN
tara:strand:- start:1032 stop:1472 length:441 start_codon:yes stop_codon:yes gene_type:complete